MSQIEKTKKFLDNEPDINELKVHYDFLVENESSHLLRHRLYKMAFTTPNRLEKAASEHDKATDFNHSIAALSKHITTLMMQHKQILGYVSQSKTVREYEKKVFHFFLGITHKKYKRGKGEGLCIPVKSVECSEGSDVHAVNCLACIDRMFAILKQ